MSGDAELDALLGNLSQASKAEPAVVGAQRAVVHKATPKSVSAPSRGAGNAPSKAVHHDDDIDNIVAHMNFDPDSEDTHATCPTCSQGILMSHEYVEIHKKRYHTKCWTCSTCHKQLLAEDFFESHHGAHNCYNCHFKTLDQCPACHKAIQGGDPIVNVEGRKYHEKCWVCVTCRQPITSYHERDGKIYCPKHFEEAFNPKCAGCHKPITGSYAQTGKGHFHVDCFKCHKCHRAIGSDKYFDTPSGIVCGHCPK